MPSTATRARATERSGRRSVRARVRALPGGTLAWQIGVTVVGVAIIAGGIALLPLPGPGWLIIFGGLGVLATEYEWARRLLAWTRAQVRRWTTWFGRQPWWVRVLSGLVVVAVAALAGWWFLIR